MTKIMTNLELIARMKELLNEPNFYGSGGNRWSTWQNGRGWYVDCTCSIKAILWGGRFISSNRGKANAGCKYKSNGVPDFTPTSCVQWTNATRGNFNNLIPGEILLMTSHGHAGLYIGNGQVIEVTPAWTGGTPGCQVSQIGKNGERVKNGKQILSWEYHGKIPVIDYVNQPSPTPVKNNIIYQTHDKVAHKYWSEVTNYNNKDSNGYAGYKGHSIDGIRAKATNGIVTVQSHIRGETWLPPVTKWDNSSSGYSGIYGKDIDMVMVKCSVGTVRYRVGIKGGDWLPWVSKFDINDSVNGMAGIYGKSIDRIQMEII